MSIKSTYSTRIEEYRSLSSEYRAKVRNSNIMRGIVFLAGIAGAIVAVNYSLSAMWIILTVSLVAFLFFIKKNSEFIQLKNYYDAMLKINENELKSINGDNSAFHGGDEYIDKSHNFSYDLDIFGSNSIFQKINRTVTGGGRSILAGKFMNPSTDISEILEIQQNSKLFVDELDARQNFMAEGMMNGNVPSADYTKNITADKYHFTNSPIWMIVAILLTACTLGAIVLSYMDIVSPYCGILLYMVQMVIFGINSGKTSALYKKIGHYSKLIKKYGKLFEIIEKIPAKPQKFSQINDNRISRALGGLAKISAMYEHRHNLMIMIFGQGIICYDIFLNIRYEKWLREYSGQSAEWFHIVHEYDFLFSLANLKYNNPDYCYPTPVEEKFVLEAGNAGHPLINPGKCVRNDIGFSNCNFLTILTGANMAGKSTYLRTIGVNLILAMAGAPVCASSMRFAPVSMITSIRTSDSVQDSESYFFAELKRLRKIVERLESGDTIFIIVDEMLRGTNSKDKHDGSKKFIEKLLKYNCYGIFATHDIDIGNMQDTYPENVNAKCFEISFEGGQLIFDYKIKAGISKNLNASYLMKKMGIID